MVARFGQDHLYGGVVGCIVLIDLFRLISDGRDQLAERLHSHTPVIGTLRGGGPFHFRQPTEPEESRNDCYGRWPPSQSDPELQVDHTIWHAFEETFDGAGEPRLVPQERARAHGKGRELRQQPEHTFALKTLDETVR